MNNRRLFFRYVVPSIIAFALSGIYTIVDGFFVGNALGDVGLATINLSYPIAAFIQALGTGIGLAGAILFTIYKSQGEKEKAEEYFSGAILLLFAVSFIVTVLFLLFATPILRLMGAEGEILNYAIGYTKIIALGAILQILATGLIPFARNMGGASFAMVSMVAGFLTNIVLDYLFVWMFGWGVKGAAIATVIGQGVTMVLAIFYLKVKKAGIRKPSKNPRYIFGTIAKSAIAPFGLTFSPIITLIVMNRFLMTYGSERTVATYACISYVTAIVYLLLQGSGDGSQPLISKYYGEREKLQMRQIRSFAYGTGLIIALVCMAGLFFTRRYVGSILGASPEVIEDVATILPMFLCTLLLLSFVRVTTSYFYATEQNRLSYILVYAEPLLLIVLLFILPPLVGLFGVWLAVPLSQALTTVIAVIIKQKTDRKFSLVKHPTKVPNV